MGHLHVFQDISAEVNWSMNHRRKVYWVEHHYLIVYCGQHVLFIMGL